MIWWLAYGVEMVLCLVLMVLNYRLYSELARIRAENETYCAMEPVTVHVCLDARDLPLTLLGGDL